MGKKRVNPYNLKRDDLKVFLNDYCKHGHRYCEHPNCYAVEQKDDLRIGFFDIETSNLQADFGIMLSYAIKDSRNNDVLSGVITRKDLMDGTLDKNLVRACINDLERFDEIITYYGTKFDIPFLRSRALYWGLDFPLYGYIKHKDCYYMVRHRLRLHSNRLESACQLLGIKGKTHLEGTYWVKALTGDPKSLGYILDHNKKDVVILEKLYNVISGFVKETKRSI